jgi:hypothetical protein
MVAGMNKVPPGPVAQRGQPTQNLRPVAVEPCGPEPRNVLQQDGSWVGFFNQAKRMREQVSFVGTAQLLARNGVRGTRYAPGKQVNGPEGAPIDVGYVALDDLPLRAAVAAERLAGGSGQFHYCHVPEPGLFKAEGLAASSGTNLHRRQPAPW